MEGKSWFFLTDELEKNVSWGLSLNIDAWIFYQRMCQSLSYFKTSCAYIYSLLKCDPQRHKSVNLPLKSTFRLSNDFLECVLTGTFAVGNRKKNVISQMNWENNSTTIGMWFIMWVFRKFKNTTQRLHPVFGREWGVYWNQLSLIGDIGKRELTFSWP